MPDERTPRGYPLPHPEHLLADDVMVLREAFTRIDTDVTAQAVALGATTVAMADALDEVSADTTRQIRRLRLNQLLDLGL